MIARGKIDLESIHRILIDGGDDERQALTEDLELAAPDTDYSEFAAAVD
jgi:hypothetical protein